MGALKWFTILAFDRPWTPAYPGAAGWIAIVLFVLLVFVTLGALVWQKASGPATASEAKIAKESVSGFRAILLSIVVLASPLVLCYSTWRLIFPGSNKTTLVLVSRETRSRAEAEQIKKKLLQVDNPSNNQILDVGKVIDLVLAKLHQSKSFSLGEADSLETARRECLEQVKSISIEELRLGSIHEIGTNSSSAGTLPQWLVESVEMACCRLLLEKVDIRRVIVGTAGRRDAFGESTWSDAKGYLTASGRIGEDQVILTDPQSGGVPRLLAAAQVPSGSATKITLLLTFRLPSNSWVSSIDDFELVVNDDKGGQYQTEKVTLSREKSERLATVIRTLSWPDSKKRPRSISAFAKPSGASSQVLVAVGRFPASLLLTSGTWPDGLSGTASANTWMAKVYEELSRQGNVLDHPALIKIAAGVAPVSRPISDAVVIELRADGAWLYRDGDSIPEKPAMSTASNPTGPWSISLGGLSASVWSLDLYQSTAGRPPAIATARRVVVGTAIALPASVPTTGPTDLLNFNQPLPSPDKACVAVLPDSRSRNDSLVWIGLPNPSALAGTAYEASYWWTLLRATSLCLSPPPVDANSAVAGDRPVLLPNADDIQLISAQTFEKGVLWLAISLVFTGFGSVCFAFRSKGDR